MAKFKEELNGCKIFINCNDDDGDKDDCHDKKDECYDRKYDRRDRKDECDDRKKDDDCEKEKHHHHHHRCECPEPEFAEVYSQLNQTLSASPGPSMKGGVAMLEKQVFATPNIDISQAAGTGKIFVNKSGWYDVYTGICAALNPVQSPLKVWTLSLFLNGVIVPGSTFANMTISPEQKSNQIVADVFVHFTKGDYVQLCNTSDGVIDLTAPTLGSNAQSNSAYLKLILLKAD